MNARPADIPVAELWRTADRPEVIAAMRAFHAETDARVAAHQAVCRNRGDCCRFGRFDHRLFVTALEVAYYLASGPLAEAPEEDTCPHARDGLCHARDRRFTGCRVFFCDPNAQHWQGPLTEERLARLRQLHEEVGVEYFYADWITVLRALNDAERHESRRS